MDQELGGFKVESADWRVKFAEPSRKLSQMDAGNLASASILLIN